MTVINFVEAKREKQLEKRYNEMDKFVHLGQHELFDEWIAEEERTLTDKRIDDCNSYIRFLNENDCSPVDVFQEVIFLDPDDFMATFGVDWLEAIEAALTYYSILKKHNKPYYDLTLLDHPFIGVV